MEIQSTKIIRFAFHKDEECLSCMVDVENVPEPTPDGLQDQVVSWIQQHGGFGAFMKYRAPGECCYLAKTFFYHHDGIVAF